MIYFDNSATTYPKPVSVRYSVENVLKRYSFNSGRGGYRESLKTSEKLFSVREKIGTMFNCRAENVVFTKNCTEALNLAIKSYAKRGGHIIISSLEHNSVARVVHNLYENKGIEYTVVPFSFDVKRTLNRFEKAVRGNTNLAVFTAASNVFGVTLPIKEIGKICKEKGIRFVVDAAQAAGVIPIDMKGCNIDSLCAPGHKALMGPLGTGFAAFKSDKNVVPLLEGGTGSSSLSLKQPLFLPDSAEAGTLNNIGIIGLGAGLDYLKRKGINNIYNHEMKLLCYLYEKLSSFKDVKLYTPKPEAERYVPVMSFNYGDYSSEDTALKLSKMGICLRAGYHCSPLAHKHFNTLDKGTVRISLSAFNSLKDCNSFINSVKKL